MHANPVRRIAQIFILAVATFIGIGAMNAYANTYPGTHFPDAGPHTGCWVPNPSTTTLPDPLWDAYHYIDLTMGPPIGLDLSWEVCTTQTDMKLDDRLSDPTAFGRAQCLVLSGNTCTSWSVMINVPEINAAADANFYGRNAVQQFNWCHEIGHSLGLQHEDKCMLTGVQTWRVYSLHQISHLNAQF